MATQQPTDTEIDALLTQADAEQAQALFAGRSVKRPDGTYSDATSNPVARALLVHNPTEYFRLAQVYIEARAG